MQKQLEITIVGIHLAHAVIASERDVVKLYHKINDVLYHHSTLQLSPAQRKHLADGHVIIVRDEHGNRITVA